MLITSREMIDLVAEMLSTAYVQIFLIFVVMDIATGLTKAVLGKQANSTKGLLGVVKHMLVVMLVLSVYPYMRILNFDSFATAFVIFYVATYAISIIENLHMLGIPFPSIIRDKLEKIKDKVDKNM